MEYKSNTTLKKIYEKENGEKILHKHGVPCVSCPHAQHELSQLEIGDVCAMYDLDVMAILEDLNK